MWSFWGKKTGLSVPLCTNGIARKAFHIETSVFLAKYCLYPWDSTLRVWSVWTIGFLKWFHHWIQGHGESSWKGWGCPNSHGTKDSSLRNILYPNTPFNSVISTSQQKNEADNKNEAELAIISWGSNVSFPLTNQIALTAWWCVTFSLNAEWPCVLEGKTCNITNGYNAIRSAL